jgi:hypothetical protein
MKLLSFERGFQRVTRADLERELRAVAPDVTGVRFRGNVELADDVLDVLEPYLPRFTHLDLTGVPIRATGAARLANDPRANRLDTLRFGAAMAIGLHGPGLTVAQCDPKWRVMATCQLGDDGVLAIAAARELRGLRTLDLSHAVATADTWRAFVRSPPVARVAGLMLDAIELDVEMIEALCANATALESLLIRTTGADAAAEAIARSPIMPQLRSLDLGYVSHVGVRAILDAHFPSLATFSIYNQLDDAIVAAIRERRGIPGLRTIRLPSNTSIGTGTYDDFGNGATEITMNLRDAVAKYLPDDTLVFESSDG